jgi:hypothetical protein
MYISFLLNYFNEKGKRGLLRSIVIFFFLEIKAQQTKALDDVNIIYLKTKEFYFILSPKTNNLFNKLLNF